MRGDTMQGWERASLLAGQCATCKEVVREGGRILDAHAFAACEYGQPWFPNATKCVRYQPEDQDE